MNTITVAIMQAYKQASMLINESFLSKFATFECQDNLLRSLHRIADAKVIIETPICPMHWVSVGSADKTVRGQCIEYLAQSRTISTRIPFRLTLSRNSMEGHILGCTL